MFKPDHGTIYIIRHGETDGNLTKYLQGCSKDNPLNAKGLAQAQKVMEFFKDKPLDAIYSSPLKRAQQTAAPLAESKGLKIHTVPGFKEISFGDWEGIEMAEIERRWASQMMLFFKQPSRLTIPGGRPFAEVQREAWTTFQNILEKEGHGRQIAMVAHGGVIRLLMCAFLEMPLDRMWSLSVYNASVITINEWDGNLVLTRMNEEVEKKLDENAGPL